MDQVNPGDRWLFEGLTHPYDYGFPEDMRVPNQMLYKFWRMYYPEMDYAEMVDDVFKACDQEKVN